MFTTLVRELDNKTVPQWLERQAREHGSRLALSAPSCAGHRERLTYAQLVARMRAMARSLHARGVCQGGRVVLLMPNAAAREAVLTALGSWQLGAVIVPLNARLSAEETTHAFNLINPVMTVVAKATDIQRLAELEVPAGRILSLENAQHEKTAWPDPEWAHDAPLPTVPDVSWNSLSALLFTSGTTARAKAVMYTHRSQLHTGLSMGMALELGCDDVYQVAAPVYTSSFFGLACMAAWVRGAAVVFESDRLTNQQRLQCIESEVTTVFHAVPAILSFMIDEFDPRLHDIGSLETVAYGGSVMPLELIKKYERVWPRVRKLQVWGMTETGPAGTVLPPWMLPRKMGAIGVPAPGCAMRIVDENNEAELVDRPVGEVGEMVFGGPTAALGYLDNEAATRQTFVDGWVRTGDLGHVDVEGVIYFADRKKDIINRGGLKVASAAIEDALLACSDVVEAAAVALPHPKLGEDIAACIVLRDGSAMTRDELTAICRSRLTENMVPRHWFFLKELPRNEFGKVLKRVLRQQVLELGER